MKIIDVHTHIFPPEIEKERVKISQREPWFEAMTASKIHRWGTAESLVRHMDENGIDSAFATGFAFRDQGLCRLMNDYVLDSALKYSGRIRPLAVISPAARGAEKEIMRVAELGAVGIGELFPDGQNLDISRAEETRRMVGACTETGMFIMFHTAEQVGHVYPGKGRTGPVEAAAFCMNHPETRVVFAHFGGGLWAYESMPEMRLILSNAFYDTAAWPWLYNHKIIESIFAAGVGKKILFGTDWPILKYPRFSKLVGRCGLDDKNKWALLCGNSLRLLKDN